MKCIYFIFKSMELDELRDRIGDDDDRQTHLNKLINLTVICWLFFFDAIIKLQFYLFNMCSNKFMRL